MNRDLDIMAGTIIERLKHHGADLMLDENGLWVQVPEPGVGRRSEQPDEWARGFTDGAIMELRGLIRIVPGLREAIKSHIRAWPSAADNEGRLLA